MIQERPLALGLGLECELPNPSPNPNPNLKRTCHDHQENPHVKWDDIAELSEVKRVLKESNPNPNPSPNPNPNQVKRVLKESLVMPLRFPHLFVGRLQPWNQPEPQA